jgi:hypothetical protein
MLYLESEINIFTIFYCFLLFYILSCLVTPALYYWFKIKTIIMIKDV